MRNWRIALLAGVLIAALVGLASGNLGSSLFWGLLAIIGLAAELFEARNGPGGSMAVAFLYGIVVSLMLVAVAVGLSVAAALADSEEERGPLIGGAVLVAPIAALACWGTIAGYRRVRRMQLDSHPRRPASEVYAELVATAQAQRSAEAPDPQRKTRQRRMVLFGGIAAVGWGLGRIVQMNDDRSAAVRTCW